MTASISKLLLSWLFVDPSEHHYTTQTSKFNNFFNRSSTMLNNVFKVYCDYTQWTRKLKRGVINKGVLPSCCPSSLSCFRASLLPNKVVIESQNGVIAVQRCSVENQKGAIVQHNIYGDSALLVLSGTSLNCKNALLTL